MTIDVSTAIWILGGFLAIISVLIGVIWSHVNKSIDEAKDLGSKAHARLDQEIKDRTTDHDALEKTIQETADDIRGKVHDLDVTVAGFGGTYVTRSEVNDLRSQSGGRTK